ncbi:MAG TPA: Flp pilus assembly protein CpaB [Dehalococcoidia bacterium]|nr:Flp pilus assembly protein CpaB [Dehalococcoidia bacterium]
MAGNAMTRGLRGRPERVALLLALAFGAVAALLVAVALSSGSDSSGGDGAVPVLVARQAIGPGSTISADMVEVRQVPAAVAVDGALRSPELAVGRVALLPISAGEQVQARDVAAPSVTAASVSTDMPLSYVVPPGMRAVSIPIEEATAAGGLVRPGDRVDVIGVFDVTFYGLSGNPSESTDFNNFLSMTVLQDVEVLAVAQAVEPVVPSAGQGSGGQAPRVPVEQVKPNPKAATITLAVTPEQAQRLAWALSNGELRVALRRFGETGEVPVYPGTNLDFLPQLTAPTLRR